MEDNLKKKNGRQTQKKMEDELKKKWKTISKNKVEDEPINQNLPNWL
jgi:hypothetical protein